MTPEQFWEKIDSYCKKHDISLQRLCKDVDIDDSYLYNLKRKKNNFPSIKKFIRLRKVFTDDEMFEVLKTSDRLTEEQDEIFVSLNISQEMRMKSRLERKIRRGETT